MADMKGPTPKSQQKRGVGGDGLGGALGVHARALVQDVMKRIIWYLTNSHHVDHGRGVISLRQINLVEVIDVVVLDVVDEKVVDGVLVRRSCAYQPERIGPRHILHWGLVVDQVQAGRRELLTLHCTPFWSYHDH